MTTEEELSLGLAEARYLMVRFYRPFLQTGQKMSGAEVSVYNALVAHITRLTVYARVAEINTRKSLPNLIGITPSPPIPTFLQEEMQKADLKVKYSRQYLSEFMAGPGAQWLREGYTSGVIKAAGITLETEKI